MIVLRAVMRSSAASGNGSRSVAGKCAVMRSPRLPSGRQFLRSECLRWAMAARQIALDQERVSEQWDSALARLKSFVEGDPT